MRCRWFWAWALVGLVAACGGGGGDEGSSSGTRTPLPVLSEDTNPTGPRVDYRARNYFPMTAGDSWNYQRVSQGVESAQAHTRTAQAGIGGDMWVIETFSGSSAGMTYRRGSEGLILVQPLGQDVPAAVSQRVGDLLEYPEPFYPAGAVRRVVRQGSYGVDADSDGILESFRFEFEQVFVGLETLPVAGQPVADVARFRNTVRFTVQPSSRQVAVVTVTGLEETWWAPGLGLVRAERRIVDGSGANLEPPYTLNLTASVVGGAPMFGAAGDGTTVKIALPHKALVHDRGRNVYWASVPGSALVNGNRIASISAAGAVSYSAPVGPEPSALALSADGSALFVGLNGSGEILKLRLPDLTEQWRARLPTAPNFGQLLPEDITVSPVDADVVAVSTIRPGVSPRHGGVVLIRGGAVQPVMTQDHTGSNLITFDANGQYVYGFNNETTEFGLRRLAVLPNGLAQELVVPALGNFGTRTLDWHDGRLVLDRWVYSAPALAQLGSVGVTGGGCRPHSVPNRLLCNPMAPYSTSNGQVAVVDSASFAVLSLPFFQRGPLGADLREIVPGASGQAALRMGDPNAGGPPNSVWLFTSPYLQ